MRPGCIMARPRWPGARQSPDAVFLIRRAPSSWARRQLYWSMGRSMLKAFFGGASRQLREGVLMNVQQDHVLHSRDGKFEQDTSSLSDVVRILGQAQESAPEHGIVIHFDGGLVGQESSRVIADTLVPRYAQAGAYPLLYVWQSGLIERLKNNLGEILADPAFRELVKKVSEWVLKKIGDEPGLKGVRGPAVNEDQLRREFDRWFSGKSAQLPVSNEGKVLPTLAIKGVAGSREDELAEEIEAGLDGDPDFRAAIQKLYDSVAGGAAVTRAAGAPAVATVALVDEQARAEMFCWATASSKGELPWIAVAKFVARIVTKVIGRYAQGRAHGMYCTVVEEVLRSAYGDKAGVTLWNQMKKDTADSFGSGSQCCGAAVVRELGKLHAAGRTFKKITLVGHSAGAVHLCEFLDAASVAAAQLKFDVVFLAPALRHERFARVLARHRHRIAHFRLFGMSDAIESDDVLASVLYPRSLLYFVSGVLEGHVEGGAWKGDTDAPIVGMQRYLHDTDVFNSRDFPEVEHVRRFLQGIPDSEVWSESSAGNGRDCLSRRHGDFDSDEATVGSVAWIIAH